MVTRKQKIREIPIPTWVVQRVKSLIMRDGRYIDDGNEPLFINRFSNETDFGAALHEGGITVVE